MTGSGAARDRNETTPVSDHAFGAAVPKRQRSGVGQAPRLVNPKGGKVHAIRRFALVLPIDIALGLGIAPNATAAPDDTYTCVEIVSKGQTGPKQGP
jgi:hypothetical protein